MRRDHLVSVWTVTRQPDGELPIAHRPQASVYDGRISARSRRRRRRLRRGRCCPCLMRSASSFTSITASQKKATACHSSLRRTMARTKARREKSPPPITPTKIRRCSSQAGHTSTVCSTVSSGLATQWRHPGVSSARIRRRNLLNFPCPVRTIIRKVRTP
ncbi:hypothetical protein PYW08_011882 [Mythimna loreyi]|uniref:Uncharacterized protein n=1 Tax=Mythimna loreyi TaxID=667449 RepID=A0ACC2QMS8_9NEOP|nr:hypothetical protein PYW08_011882 [Mythimna loreyi]